MNDCKCYATAIDPERQAMWKRIFPPDGHVPITSPVPVGRGELAGEASLYYLVDLTRVNDSQREVLIHEIAKKFSLTEEELKKLIKEHGVPVKADSVMVSWCALHGRAAM